MTKISQRETLWIKFIKIEAKILPLEGEQGFEQIWPSDLVFNSTWLIFELDSDIIKTNILVYFHEDWSKTNL